MSDQAIERARWIAGTITGSLGGLGIFGVELFVRGDEVYFSEVSPRPHDTGMVTMISQDLSEFALHARAVLKLPIPEIRHLGPSASCVIMGEGDGELISYDGLDAALAEPDTQVRLFGKPEIRGKRRMGVALSRADTIERALEIARDSAAAVTVKVEGG
jgi:phosphoribosylglycinamide formyltransferase 2